MQDHNDNTPQEPHEPQQPQRYVTSPDQMPQPPSHRHTQQPSAPLQTPTEEPVSMGDWMITIVLTSLPLVGLILLFVWAFSGDTKPSKANWAKATLLWAAIIFVLTALFYAVMAAAFAGAITEALQEVNW